METIDQLSVILSLGTTLVIGVVALWSYRRRLCQGTVDISRGVSKFRAWSIAGGFFCGTVLVPPLVWLIKLLDLAPYFHHFALFVWVVGFLANLALGVVVASIGTWMLERNSAASHSLNPDARKPRA
jgi:hypothetical protein